MRKIIKSPCFADENGIEILTNAYLEKRYHDENFDCEYNISNGYIELKKKHNIVSKICHLKCKPTTDNANYDFIDMFIDEMKLLYRVFEKSLVSHLIKKKNLKI